ncbi:hypothetical protein RvY_16917 [Ramazzottius varieornatus]|uniref:Uncharacterized protein n=1 Tax=Ramazzottius varieornatus TaxID=947166 RepID=A0A1D1W177_RAMVA|nr:hypothetical protein RvY_16917 [Ramazzottius varieornatus]
MTGLYDEARICWTAINSNFMLILGAAFGLDVSIMLEHVVALVGALRVPDPNLRKPWMIAYAITLNVSAVVFTALHLLASAITLVAVYEQCWTDK